MNNIYFFYLFSLLFKNDFKDDIHIPNSVKSDNNNFIVSKSKSKNRDDKLLSNDKLKFIFSSSINEHSYKKENRKNSQLGLHSKKSDNTNFNKKLNKPNKKRFSSKKDTNILQRNYYFFWFLLLVILGSIIPGTRNNLEQFKEWLTVTYNYQSKERKTQTHSQVPNGGNPGSLPNILPYPLLRTGGEAYVTNTAKGCYGQDWCNQNDNKRMGTKTKIKEDLTLIPQYQWGKEIESITLKTDNRTIKCTGYEKNPNDFVEDGYIYFEEKTSQGKKEDKIKYGELLESFPTITKVEYKDGKIDEEEKYIIGFHTYNRGTKYVIAKKGDLLGLAFEYGGGELGNNMGYPLECGSLNNFRGWYLRNEQKLFWINHKINQPYHEIFYPITKETINLTDSEPDHKVVIKELEDINNGINNKMFDTYKIAEVLIVVKDDVKIYSSPNGKLLNKSITEYQGDMGHKNDASSKYIGIIEIVNVKGIWGLITEGEKERNLWIKLKGNIISLDGINYTNGNKLFFGNFPNSTISGIPIPNNSNSPNSQIPGIPIPNNINKIQVLNRPRNRSGYYGLCQWSLCQSGNFDLYLEERKRNLLSIDSKYSNLA